MKKTLLTLSLMLGLANTTHAEPLTPTPLHAVLGIVTNFILDDGIVHNGTSYGTVTSPYTGRVWLDRNLGAKRVCTSFDDTQCYGDYYQWGRNADGHQDSTSSTADIQATDVNSAGSSFIKGNGDWASVDGAGTERMANWSATDGSSVCPLNFRVPTIAELKAELLDVGSAEIANSTDTFNSFLKFPSVGHRATTGVLENLDSFSLVWSSSVAASGTRFVLFSGDFASEGEEGIRAIGSTVRCLRD